MNIQEMQFGELNCHVVDALPPDKPPELAAVLCHGFGAPANDLVPLAPELLHADPQLAASVRFVFPAAPLSLDDQGIYGGRAWWPLNVARLAEAIERGELRDQRGQLPPELPAARQAITHLLQMLQTQWQLPLDRVVLGGFSQGAILATDVALHLPQPPAGLCIWSGTLICEETWRQLAGQRQGLRVLQSHGRQDSILPYDGAVWLRDVLQDAGADLEFIPFDGMHTIPLEAIAAFARLLSTCCSG